MSDVPEATRKQNAIVLVINKTIANENLRLLPTESSNLIQLSTVTCMKQCQYFAKLANAHQWKLKRRTEKTSTRKMEPIRVFTLAEERLRQLHPQREQNATKQVTN